MIAINSIPIEDTFAEAFPMTAARLVVTAETPGWALTAGQVATGYASSVIGCDAEAGIERTLIPEETLDGRPGVSLLLFAFSRDALQKRRSLAASASASSPVRRRRVTTACR